MIQRMLAIWSLVPLPFLNSLDIWKFLVHIMLKPSTQDFKRDLTKWEVSAIVQWLAHSLVLSFLGIERIELFQSCGHHWVFQICWHIEFNTLIASSFRVLNSSTGIPSHPLALLAAVLPKAHLTSHSRMSGSGWVTTPSWLSISLRIFCTVLCILAISSWSLLLLLSLYHFCPFLYPSWMDSFGIFQFSWRDL